MQLAEASSQFHKLPFVHLLLALGVFQDFKHLFHFIHRLFQGLDDVCDLLDCLPDG
jgi:hypothetical protein